MLDRRRFCTLPLCGLLSRLLPGRAKADTPAALWCVVVDDVYRDKVLFETPTFPSGDPDLRWRVLRHVGGRIPGQKAWRGLAWVVAVRRYVAFDGDYTWAPDGPGKELPVPYAAEPQTVTLTRYRTLYGT